MPRFETRNATVSRRTFLAAMAAGGAGLMLGRQAVAVQAEAEPWYAWLSDTHIAADPKAVLRETDLAGNLRAAVADVLAQPGRPRAVLITGDLAVGSGQPGDYRTLAGLLEPLRGERVPVHMMLGNHDNRENFRAEFKVEPPPDEAIADRHVAVVNGPGIRFLLLDSNLGGREVAGELGERQRGWLAQALDAEPDTPTLLFLHHPPQEEGNNLRDTREFLEIVRPRRQVKAVVYGHSHHWSHTQDDGLYLINLPAVAYPFGPHPTGWVRFRPTPTGGELTLHALGGDRTRHGERVALTWRS